MLSFALMQQTAYRRELVPVLTLAGMSILLTVHRLWNISSSIGMLNTDSEGTAWWIWSRCIGQTDLARANGVAYPRGFNLETLPTFNLIDEFRILVAHMSGCSSSSIIIQLALFPTICLIGNSLAGYFAGRILFQHRLSGFLLGITCAFSSQTLLATRTPLANNVLFFGLLAVGFSAKWLRDGSINYLILTFISQAMQVLSNVYNGFAFLLIVLMVLMTFPSSVHLSPSRRIRISISIVVASLIGLGPLIANQIQLLTNSSFQKIYRPFDAKLEVLPFSSLFTKDRGLYDLFGPVSWPRPEAGWLSIPLLIGLMYFTFEFFRDSQRDRAINRAVISTFSVAFFLILIIWDVPGFSYLRRLYFAIFFPLRGVSNFAKVLPLLMGLALLLMVQVVRENHLINRKRPIQSRGIICAFFLLLLADNVPLSQSYWRVQDVRPFISTYGSPDVKMNSGPVAEFPDFMYGPQWGLPQRFIQLAQIGDSRPRLNGRDFGQLSDGSNPLPLPVDDLTLNALLNRGATTIILHRNLISPAEFNRSVGFLRSQNFQEHTSVRHGHVDPIYISLVVTIFEID